MNEGDLLLDRYRLRRAIPGRDAVQHWRALDELTNTEVDLLVLSAARGSADDQRSFQAVHEALHRLVDVPRLAHTYSVHRDADRMLAARTPLSGQTLADVRGPLPWRDVEAIGKALGPAVLAAGPSLRGALLPTDIALDASGQPVLAPRGAPLNRVVRGTTKAVAPEAFRDGSADGPTALYGLGVLLYRLATGREPSVGTSGAPPAPPSTHRPGIPDRGDQAILGLLSHEPSRRASALEHLSAGDLPDLAPRARRVPLGEVVTTATAERSPGPQAPDAPAWVVVRPDQLRKVDPRTRSLLAGMASVPATTVQQLAAEDLPLVIEASPSPLAAQRRARTLTAESGFPIHSTSGAGVPSWVPLLGTGLLALVPLLLAPMAAMLGWWFLVVPLLVVVTIAVASGTMMALGAEQRRTLHQAASRAWALQADRGDAGLLEPAWAQLATVRVHLAQTDLPTTADTDLRRLLAELEDQLTRLAGQERTIDDAHARVDAAGLRTRLAALDRLSTLDEARTDERARLTRTLADLDAVDDRRSDIEVDARRIRDTLTELTSVLAQLGDDPTDALLGRLARAARDGATPTDYDTEDDRLRRARAAQREPSG